MSIHDGHRQRLKEQFAADGLDRFTPYQVLELLLFYCIPRRDTNVIAHALMDHFGSLSQVLDAPAAELAKIPGMGEGAATFLHLVTAAGRFYQVDKASQNQVLPTLESCAEYMLPYFYGRKVETVFLLCLDAKCKVLGCKLVGEGGINSAGISTRKIVETALGMNASTVVLAHNHPSGLALPSPEDMQTTKRIAVALQAVEVVLADHVIVADEDYVSIASSDPRFNQCLLI